ncbi:hypothetical protein GCM10023144_45830 [Pigmentiphaga soli]|uniref:General secretion pathway protein GspL n=1 Tax=Pigmentiphaga soli TaxID=1007095 RepID=A0ABP8HRE4_9BURK
MKTTLRLELPALHELGADSPVAFALLDRQHAVLRSGELPLAGIAAGLPPSRIEAILHPGDAILASVTVPPLPPHRMDAAVAGAIEPMLLGDIEQLAVAHGPRAADGTMAVAWGVREALAGGLRQLADCGLAADALLPAPFALPLADGGWTALVRGGQIVVRTGPQSGYCWAIDPLAADADEPAAAALRLAAEQENPPSIAWVGAPPPGWTAPAGVAASGLDGAQRWRGTAPAWSLALPALRPRRQGGSRWKRPLAWSAAAAAVWILGLNVQAWRLEREERALRQQMAGQVKAAFPDIPVIVDPLRQAQQGRDALRAAGGTLADSDFLPLALATAKLLPQAAGNLATLRFADAELRLRLVDADIGMTRPAAPARPAPGPAPARRFGLRSTAPQPAPAAAPAQAAIDPEIVQRAQTLNLQVDRIDGEWRIRPAVAGEPGAQRVGRLRIQPGAPR